VGEYEENEKNKGNESFKAKEYAAVRASSLSELLFILFFASACTGVVLHENH
jgi:hypothetical protein